MLKRHRFHHLVTELVSEQYVTKKCAVSKAVVTIRKKKMYLLTLSNCFTFSSESAHIQIAPVAAANSGLLSRTLFSLAMAINGSNP